MKKSRQTIGERIKQLRLARKLNKSRLAALAGRSDVTILKLERGDIKNPSSATLSAVAQALGVSPRELLTGETIEGESAAAWPLRATPRQIEALSAHDKALLDALVSTFVTFCAPRNQQ
jgi:transcriptional regulator with XRE-family HTH domain